MVISLDGTAPVFFQVSRITSVAPCKGDRDERWSVIRFGGPHESGWVIKAPPEDIFAGIRSAAGPAPVIFDFER